MIVVGRRQSVFVVDVVVFILILQSKVQVVNQIEEIRVMVGCNVVSMGLQEVVRIVGVVVEFWQNVGSGCYVVYYVVVMIVVERVCVVKFQVCECQMSLCLIVGVFSVVCLNVVFLLVVIGQLVVDLGFVFYVYMYVGLVVVDVFVVREVVQIVNFIVQV